MLRLNRELALCVLLTVLSSAVHVDAVCDESKCRSPNLEAKKMGIKAYDCIAKPPEEPFSCAAGYTGRAVKNYPNAAALNDYSYYTCCTSDATDAEVTSECMAVPGVCTSNAPDGEMDCWAGCRGDKFTCANADTDADASAYQHHRTTGGELDFMGQTCYQYICCKTAGAVSLAGAVRGAASLQLSLWLSVLVCLLHHSLQVF